MTPTGGAPPPCASETKQPAEGLSRALLSESFANEPHPSLQDTLPKSKGFGEGWGRAETRVNHAAKKVHAENTPSSG